MNTTLELPINQHISTFGNKKETGIKPGSGRYDILSKTLNTTRWGGRSLDFQVSNLSLNRLIVGSKCFMAFRCTASLNDDSDVLTASPVELRDGAGNLLLDSIDLMISGTSVHHDGYCDITRNWYEHLAKTNFERTAGMTEDRHIGPESGAFDSAAFTIFDTGIRKTAITDAKEFTLIRPLTDVAFFGPRDNVIPSALPMTLQTHMASNPDRVFNTDNTIVATPKLNIIDVEFHVYSVEMEDAFSQVFQDSLRAETLLASADSWQTVGFGSQIASAQTFYNSNDTIRLETTPDAMGIAFYKNSVINAAAAYKGVHPLTTDWLNITKASIRSHGAPLREYRNLGGNASTGQKSVMLREMDGITGGETQPGLGACPIDSTVFAKGALSFIPVVHRTITEDTVLTPTPTSITFDVSMSPNAGADSQGYVFYKLRHQWKLSSQTGQTAIVR